MFKKPINIIGCGAVGSTVGLLLAKMGAQEFRLWDADVVEEHNLPNQQYLPRHVGQPKVDALENVLTEFNPAIKVKTFNKFFTTLADAKDVEGVLVIATDSIKSRKDIYSTFQNNLNINLITEARLSFEQGEIHILDPFNLPRNRTWLNNMTSDEQVPEGPCNLRLCTTLVTTISSILVQYICTYFVQLEKNENFDYNYGTIFVMDNNNIKIFTHGKESK